MLTHLKLEVPRGELPALLDRLQAAGFASSGSNDRGQYAELSVEIHFEDFSEINPKMDKIFAIYNEIYQKQL